MFVCEVEIGKLLGWLRAIPFEEWPQQDRLPDDLLRPSMVTDLRWYGFGRATDEVVAEVLRVFPGTDYQRMLSVVMPGHDIPTHVDQQNPDWVGRIHVPLLSNPESEFVVGGGRYVMTPGRAYAVDTRVPHSVTNWGKSPRVHFMFDVRR